MVFLCFAQFNGSSSSNNNNLVKFIIIVITVIIKMWIICKNYLTWKQTLIIFNIADIVS